ncbi:unnamed protein product [Protopolystoma xenopodis]|uniref:Uncharacterized protein n=1 Tax=Protopolystoma xenopodis TaxID=117903 RepID=A0A3S5AYW5_9PLAT|nr:unnamed protein product [Protopolystoma xenopodis]
MDDLNCCSVGLIHSTYRSRSKKPGNEPGYVEMTPPKGRVNLKLMATGEITSRGGMGYYPPKVGVAKPELSKCTRGALVNTRGFRRHSGLTLHSSVLSLVPKTSLEVSDIAGHHRDTCGLPLVPGASWTHSDRYEEQHVHLVHSLGASSVRDVGFGDDADIGVDVNELVTVPPVVTSIVRTRSHHLRIILEKQ